MAARSGIMALLVVGLLAVPGPANAATAAPHRPADPAIGSLTAGDQRARTLYMLQDLQHTGGIWTGGAAVLRKRGRSVVGIQGALYSEYRCLQGKVRSRRLVGSYPAYTYGGQRIPAQRLDVGWRGRGGSQHMAGWEPVTRKRMLRISGGGITARLLRSC